MPVPVRAGRRCGAGRRAARAHRSAVNARAWRSRAPAERRLRDRAADVVVGYCSVTVYFDPLRVDAAWLQDEIEAAAEGLDVDDSPAPSRWSTCRSATAASTGRTWPTSRRSRLLAPRTSSRGTRARRTASTCVGFVPGFAYLAEVDPRIAAPRRSTPRPAVPAGSVAIAGGQTGVYPGRDARRLEHHRPDRRCARTIPARREPFRLHAGDRVRFRRVASLERELTWPCCAFVNRGMLTTVQDLGRWGHQALRRAGGRADGRVLASAGEPSSSATTRRPPRSRSR